MTRKIVDWEAVEIQYRAGIRSLKDIGGEFGVSDAAIIKRAKRDSWVRDLKAKIHARAEAKVSAAMVSAEVSARTKINERQTIEAVSDEIVNVRLAHRGDISRTRRLSMKLMDELEAITDDQETLKELISQMREAEDADTALLNLATRMSSLPTRTKTIKELSETLKTLVTLERQAYGIGEENPVPPNSNLTDEELERKIAKLAGL